MADNAARARQELSGQRRAISEHVAKYQRYAQQYEKDLRSRRSGMRKRISAD
jgi:hypothetical protein